MFIILVCSLFFFGCQKKTNEYYLYHGLKGYDKFRYINEEFVKGYGVQKIAFFREANQLQYTLMLADDVTSEKVEQYSLGLQVYIDKKNLPDNQTYLIWDSKPKIQNIGDNKYIINGFQEPIKQIDSLIFFLYDRHQYQGGIGKRIVIKNIELN